MTEKPEIVDAEADENPMKSVFNFMVHLKTLIHKTSVDPKMLQLKIGLRNNQKSEPPKNSLWFSPNSTKDSVYKLPETKL